MGLSGLSLPAPYVVVPLALLVAGLLAWVVWRRPWRGAKTTYPVVLAHGVMGFSRLGIGGVGRDYFHGIVEHLEALGVRVHRPAVPMVASIAERAEALAAAVRQIRAPKVHIIAHSMGGLDARYAITKLGLASKVASLTTIGTPHRGTPVADVARILSPLLSSLGLHAFLELSPAALATFNAKVPNHRGVRYRSIVATARDGEITAVLIPIHAYLAQGSGPNDGLVPATSQRWGRVLERIHGDHWAEIGWGKGLDAPALYARILHHQRAHRG